MNEATVEKPLRIDLAGGWSDTPPICLEVGGCVLNAAVTLDGKMPVRAHVRRLPDRRAVVVESVDLHKRDVLRSDTEIAEHDDPRDWRALIKCALSVVGYRLAEGGLSIRISADVPKGSGMGTSSILGAALIEALGKVRESGYTWREVSELTLRLEQEMRTGGGWQDQVGGLLPGVKRIVSAPGPRQRVRVTTLPAGDQVWLSRMLRERALLYFTGQKRMARNVLRGVVGFYRKNPMGIAAAVISRLKRDAAAGFDALRRRDWAEFCAVVNGYWLNKKALDPGSTNPMVESIIARIAPWTDAVTLCGAGGGGFMLILARSPRARAALRRVLEDYPPVSAGRFFDFELVKGTADT